ncbi:MAG: hypothetical protein K0R82_1452, partial [Flavipsychrobacter sp.]|nr:hypothetical protein [Flavipsychrobacter sp.]
NGIETDAKEMVYLGGTIGGITTRLVDLNPGPGVADKPTTGTFTAPAVAKFDGTHTPIGTAFFLAFVIPQTTGSGFSADIATNALGDFAMVGVFQGANVDFAPDSTVFLLESASNGNQQSSFAARYEGGMIWTGDSSTAWEDPLNWDGVLVPDSTNDVYIPDTGVTNQPTVANSTFINALHVSSGNTLTLNPTVVLEVENALENNATITSSGRIMLGGKIEQFISGTGSISNLELQNINGAEITDLDTQSITGAYFPTTGVLNTNNGLVLKSSAFGTAQIATGSGGGGYISGNVTVERYVPGGRRAFRFFGHPFDDTIALSQLVSDDIDITGSGGATNGFTPTGTNNPSAFYYDQSLGDTTTVGNNPGWLAYTSANTAQWQQYQAARILIRGTKGQGLTSAPYTPNAVTLDMSGAVNQGTQPVNFIKGDTTDFVLVGNPFPSQIDLNLTTRSNIGSAFIVWDANQGVKGGYTSSPFSSSYIFPSCGSFVTTLTAASGSITFEEADKSTGVPTSLFKTTAATNTVQLRIVDDTLFWDRILLRFDPAASSTKDYEDAVKLNNPDLDFNTLSADGRPLSIDTRPYVNGEVIQLGLRAFVLKTYKIIVPDFDMPAGTKLYLHDKYLNKIEEVYAGYEYAFTVTADTLSQGKRFALNLIGDPNIVGEQVYLPDKLLVMVHPNPATDEFFVSFNSPIREKMKIRLVNITGITVLNTYTAEKNTGTTTISVNDLPAGIYIIEVTGTSGTFKQKILKQ